MSTRASLVMVYSTGAGQQDFGQLGLHLGIGQIRSPFLGHDDNIPGRQHLFMASKKLPKQAFYAVALKGLAYLAPRHQTQAAARAFPRGQADAEMRRKPTFPPGLGPEVLPAAAEPLISGKAGRLRGCGGITRGVSWAGGLGGVLQRCSLDLTPRGACGLWPGGSVVPGVPPWCSCGSGSRECGTFSIDWADRCVSWQMYPSAIIWHQTFY
jgi:hypothetical protein